MKGTEVINEIKQSLGVYGLGDINHNIDRPISCFILCMCFLDQLAAYRYNSHRSRSRFDKIIAKYLPHYSSHKLYDTLRNKLLHTYSALSVYKLVSSKELVDEDDSRHLDLLNTYNFVKEVTNVYKTIEAEFEVSGEARNNAILFSVNNPIISSSILNIMNYTNEEADFLIEYYLPKMIDKNLDESGQLQVKTIIKKQNKDGTCMIHVFPQRMATVVQFYREIGEAAKYFKLEPPEGVLLSRS